jgi:molybdopterin-synthase adenylyltransferase
MSYSAALSTQLHHQAVSHLLRDDGQEDLCFAVWYPSRGSSRTTALLHQLVLPKDGERHVHGNASFLPAYFERALGIARAAGGGLAFLHSHLGPGWQGMSPDDVAAERSHAAATKGATDLPLVGLTLGTDGAWSARFWEKTAPRTYERQWCESVRVVGDQLRVTYHDALLPKPAFRHELDRTISAWGSDAQTHLARLRIGVIGAGSVGSLVAEALARMGIMRLRLLDFDAVEVVNLDRLLYATHRDALLQRAKVEVLARALRKSATASPFVIDGLEWSVVEEEGFRAALDCDVLFCCVDRPWPRFVLNFIAYAHLIPVVDGGIFITAKRNGQGMRHADWRAHVAAPGPGRRCLECLKQYDPKDVSLERDGYLDDPVYIAGLPTDHSFRRNENVFAFSMSVASFEVLQFLSMVVAPSGISNPGAQMYHFVPGKLDTNVKGCDDTCLFPGLTARGESAGNMTARHIVAETARTQRQRLQRSWRYQLLKLISLLRSKC